MGDDYGRMTPRAVVELRPDDRVLLGSGWSTVSCVWTCLVDRHNRGCVAVGRHPLGAGHIHGQYCLDDPSTLHYAADVELVSRRPLPAALR